MSAPLSKENNAALKNKGVGRGVSLNQNGTGGQQVRKNPPEVRLQTGNTGRGRGFTPKTQTNSKYMPTTPFPFPTTDAKTSMLY